MIETNRKITAPHSESFCKKIEELGVALFVRHTAGHLNEHVVRANLDESRAVAPVVDVEVHSRALVEKHNAWRYRGTVRCHLSHTALDNGIVHDV
jgi:hypothetical protein